MSDAASWFSNKFMCPNWPYMFAAKAIAATKNAPFYFDYAF